MIITLNLHSKELDN